VVAEAGPNLPSLEIQGSVEGGGVQPGKCRAAGAADEAGAGVLPVLGAGVGGHGQGVEAGLGLMAATDALRLGDGGERLQVFGICRAELGLPEAVRPVVQRLPLGPELAGAGPVEGRRRRAGMPRAL
jgi:hypothetical protein